MIDEQKNPAYMRDSFALIFILLLAYLITPKEIEGDQADGLPEGCAEAVQHNAVKSKRGKAHRIHGNAA